MAGVGVSFVREVLKGVAKTRFLGAFGLVGVSKHAILIPPHKL